jgi:hypothetical protein
MNQTAGVASGAGTTKRVLVLLFGLNVLVLCSLLYSQFGRSLTPSGGVSFVLANDMLTPMLDVSMSYPGGSFALPRLDPKKSVGNPITLGSPFEATLSFKDDRGNTIQQAFMVKPLGELLIVIHVLPELEEAVVKTAEGKEDKIIRPAASKVKILTTYQGDNYNI